MLILYQLGLSYPLRNTLCNDGNRPDLGALHQLHGGAVDGTRGGEVDDGVDVRVFGHGFGDILVDGEEGLAGAPIPVMVLEQFMHGHILRAERRTSC